MNITVKKGNDPFKKYWWVILLGFGAIGGWVCLPFLEQPIGGAVVKEQGLKPADQSLDPASNPNGAPGQAVDLSMEGAYRKKTAEGPITSSLYQAPAEAAAPGSPLTSGSDGSGASFAAALKAVSQKTDASGWGGIKVQKAFTPPRAGFGALSGLGGGGGSGGSGAGLAMSAFGTSNPRTGVTTTRGLGQTDAGQQSRTGAPVMGSLRSAQAQGQTAQMTKSLDLAAGLAGKSFDNGQGGSAISGGGQALNGTYANLDAVPMNLKANDYSANKFEYQPPAAAVAEMDTSQEQKRQMLMAIAGALVGGIIGGTTGQMISMTMMMASFTQGRSQNSGSNVTGQTKGKTSQAASRRQAPIAKADWSLPGTYRRQYGQQYS